MALRVTPLARRRLLQGLGALGLAMLAGYLAMDRPPEGMPSQATAAASLQATPQDTSGAAALKPPQARHAPSPARLAGSVRPPRQEANAGPEADAATPALRLPPTGEAPADLVRDGATVAAASTSLPATLDNLAAAPAAPCPLPSETPAEQGVFPPLAMLMAACALQQEWAQQWVSAQVRKL